MGGFQEGEEREHMAPIQLASCFWMPPTSRRGIPETFISHVRKIHSGGSLFDEVSWEAAVFGVVVAIPIIASVLFLASQLFMQANTSGNPGNPEVGPLTGRETLKKMKVLAEASYARTGDVWWKEKLQWIDKQLAMIRNA